MKHIIKIICLFLSCLSLSSCNILEAFEPLLMSTVFYYDSIEPEGETFSINDVNVFFDGSYKEYDGGEEASVFFSKYVKLYNYKDMAFRYRYTSKTATFNSPIIIGASAYAVDVYYEEEDFYSAAEEIVPYVNKSEGSHGEYLAYTEPVAFFITRIIDETLNQDNLYTVMFDKKHFTIRYVFVSNYYQEDFTYNSEPFLPGEDDWKIDDMVSLLLMLKWNNADSYGNDRVEDWVFDYSDIIDIDTSEESSTVITE